MNIKKLSIAMMLFALTNTASAAVLDFEGLGDSNSVGTYGGFSFSNMYSLSQNYYNSSSNNTLTFASGTGAAYNGYGTSAGLTNGSTFDFNGIALSGWTYNNSEWYANAHSVTINGYNNSNLVNTFTANLALGAMQYFNVGFTNVDQLSFTSDGNNRWFLADNFTYNSNVSTVPVPAAVWLFGSGIVGLIGASKRKKASTVVAA